MRFPFRPQASGRKPSSALKPLTPWVRGRLGGLAAAGLLLAAPLGLLAGHRLINAFYRPALNLGSDTQPSLASMLAERPPSEGLRADPTDFTTEELQELRRRFGVHGPQPRLAQLFTAGLDSLQPLRNHTLSRLEELRPVILAEARRHRVNPMLVTAVLFDEMQHAKPGENTALAARSGLFNTHGPAQLGVGELVKQGLLAPDASAAEVERARLELLDPDRSVQILTAGFARRIEALGLPRQRMLMASTSPRDAKGLATLAYLHNGKLDYPSRILAYMQDPELHALLYGSRRVVTSPLI